MWLATKLAAGKAKMPPTKIIHDTLGEEHARRYKTLARDYPEVERGPDEDIINHYSRLNKAFDEENAQVDENPETLEHMKGRRPQAPAEVASSPFIRGKDEIEAEQLREQFKPTDLKGMPQRIPGWFTGDAVSAPPPGYGTPPMSRRDPMATMRGPVSPSARPQQQSHGDWVRWLADKGIYLDDSGQRMSPEQMALPRRPLRGPQIWEPFTRPAAEPAYGGRHRAAKMLVAYVLEKLGGPISHQQMLDDGWDFRGDHYNGNQSMGSYYFKRIGDHNHVIAKDDGWIHNSGSADLPPDEYGDPEMTETPMAFDSLGDAVMHAKRGTVNVGFSTPQKSRAVEDSSYHPERDELTRPMGKMIPPDVKGKYQTLSATWETS